MGDYVKDLRKKYGHKPIILPHSVVLLFNNFNEVLVEERVDDGYIDFPGGGIDIAESAEEAAKRELKEETGLIAEELEFFKLYSGEITYYKYSNGDEIYGIDAVYICRKYIGELTPQEEEVKKLFFVPINKIEGKISIRNKQIIKDYLEKYGTKE